MADFDSFGGVAVAEPPAAVQASAPAVSTAPTMGQLKARGLARQASEDAGLSPGFVDFVKQQEGFTAKAQWDYKQSSVGYGTKAKSAGEVITPHDAELRLHDELQTSAERIDKAMPRDSFGGTPVLSPAQREALVSFDFNTGEGPKVVAETGGDWMKIEKKLPEYTKAGGAENPGLVARRGAELNWASGSEMAGSAPSTAMTGDVSGKAVPPTKLPGDAFGGVELDGPANIKFSQGLEKADRAADATKVDAQKSWAFVTKPLLNLFPQMSQADEDQYNKLVMRFGSPSMFEQAMAMISEDRQADGSVKTDPQGLAVATGIQHTIASNLNFMTSPLGVATLGLGAAPKGVQAAVSVGFAANAAIQMPDLWTQFNNEQDPQKKTELMGAMVTQATVLGGGVLEALHLAKTAGAGEAAEAPAVNQAATNATPAATTSAAEPTEPAAPQPIARDIPTTPAGNEPVVKAPAPAPAPAPVPAARPAEEDLFGGIPEDGRTASIDAGEVRPVPTGEIAVRPDLMQFKRMDETSSGVNREDAITTKYDPMKAGNLLLWEPKEPQQYGLENGEKYIVANGHHRFARADEDGVPAQNAQVLREADGYSANDARTLAAEVNIADGKGTIYDQAKFFRNTASTHGQDEAMARAGQIGARGRKASTIAFNAGDPLFESFINERITPEQTAAIAEGAPGNQAMQRLGILRAVEGDEPETLRNFLQAVRVKAGTENARQIDLFGNDDTALKEAEAMGRRAQTIQREIREQITSVAGAAKRPEKARALGVDVTDAGSVQRNLEQLTALRDRFAEWSKDRSLIALVQDRTRSAPDVVQEMKAAAAAAAPVEAAQGDPEVFGDASPSGARIPRTGTTPNAPAGPATGGGAGAPTVQTPAPVPAPMPAQPTISLPSTRNWFQRTILPLQKFFAPQTIDPAARAIGNVIREYNAESALAVARADHELSQARGDFDRTPVPRNWKYDPNQPLPRNYAFIDDSERGGQSLSPADRKVKGQFDDMIDQWIDEVHQVSPKALQHLIQNYFPHLWTDANKAQRVYAEILSKRPLEGTKDFQKQRTHLYFRDGLEAGLVPAHDNPVDMFLMKMHEIRKFIMAQKTLAEAKSIGARKFVFVFEKAPDGWMRVDDRTSTVNAPPFVKVSEAFDAQMRGKTLDLLKKLGIPHSRVDKIAGHPNYWGSAVNINGGKIETKFAGPDQTIWHELGHVLEFRYKMSRQLTSTPEMRTELTELAKERAKTKTGAPVPNASFQNYVQSTDEKMAAVAQAYIGAPELMEKVAPNVKRAFAKFIQANPELHDIEGIKPGMSLGSEKMDIPVNGMVTLGHYYMPEGAAMVMNNFLSPGLHRFGAMRSVRAISNVLNSAQLGLSAFHVGFTSLDATVSRAAVGLQYLLDGRPIKAAGKLAGAPFAPLTNYLHGRAVQGEMLDPGSQAPEIAEIARMATAGGLRAAPDPMFKQAMTRSLMRGLREGGIKNYAMTPLRLPFAAMEQIGRPIAEYVVPRQKLGVFAEYARMAMEKLGPNATHAQVREQMTRAADVTENRMGQMTYDNLFHNRVWKDLATVGFRSYGWQLGKYREAFGAMADAATTVQRMKAGESLMTPRMAYVIALPMVVGMYGSMMNYMMTGEAPGTVQGKEMGLKGMMLDAFFPRNGRIDAQGNPQRLMLPSYLKDLISDWHDFPQIDKMGASFYHKLNPAVGVMVDELRNRDFYDVEIRDPNDPVMKQAMDAALYAIGEAKPFSVAGGMKLTEEGGDAASSWVLPFFGIVPAKKALTMTPAQTRASELIQDSLPQGARDKSAAARAQMAAKLTRDLRNHEPDATANFRRATANGAITKADAQRVQEHLAMSPLQYQVKHMAVKGAMEVWDLANPGEKQQIRKIVTEKIRNAKTINDREKRDYLRVLIGTGP